MRTFVLALLVGTIALVPAFADAQTGKGSGSGSAPSGTSGSSGSGSGSSMPSTGSGSSGSGTSPSASPSGVDLSNFKTQADCEKNGGMWTAATKSCTKK